MIISRTPFRISFFGGGTDYPGWYRRYGGAVLATTIDKYCYLSCRYLPPFFEHRIRVVWSKIERCQTVEEITHPAIREILRFLRFDRGLEVHHDGDLPARSGMGSSSAFTVGFLHAMYALQGQWCSKQKLAAESIHIEQELLRETVGSQDQVLAAYGGLNHITFQTDGEFVVKPVPLSRARLDELNSNLMLFYTGIERTAAKVAESYAIGIDSRRAQLERMRELVEEGVRILTGPEDLAVFGALLHESWNLKRSLSDQVSNSEVDGLYREAVVAGALGGKLIGAGGGGFLLLFVPPERHGRVKERLHKLIHVPFKPEFSGSQIIFFDPEVDYSREDHGRGGKTVPPFRELHGREGGEAS